MRLLEGLRAKCGEGAFISETEVRLMSRKADDGDDIAGLLAIEARAKTEGTVPGEVVKAIIEGGLSPLGAWRRHRGFSQVALAREAGLSQVWVGRIEAGGGYGSRETRRKLAAALDAPLWALEDAAD